MKAEKSGRQLRVSTLLFICLLALAPAETSRAQSRMGPITILYSPEPTLCNSMISSKREDYDSHRVKWEIVIPPDGAPVMGEGVSSGKGIEIPDNLVWRSSFDIDNDGTLDEVYGYHTDSHAEAADTLFFRVNDVLRKRFSDWKGWFDSESSDAARTNLNPLKDLVSNSGAIFPAGSRKFHLPEDFKDSKEPKALVLRLSSSRSENFSFAFRYLRIKPFTWHGNTFLLLHDDYADMSAVQAVVRLDAALNVHEACIFRFKESCLRRSFGSFPVCEIKLK